MGLIDQLQQLQGLGFRDLHSFFKDFALMAATKLQVRMEVYNITNTASFANPISQLGAPGFGSVNSIGNSIPRQMQFAVKLLF